jgi:hypothetical protein
MKKLGLLIVLTITAVISYGQQRTISGTVTSAVDGKPVSGVKIILVEEKIDIKKNGLIFVETKIKTKTNENGEYELTVPDTWKNVVRFKRRPYSTIDVKLDNRTELNLSMTLDARQDK